MLMMTATVNVRYLAYGLLLMTLYSDAAEIPEGKHDKCAFSFLVTKESQGRQKTCSTTLAAQKRLMENSIFGLQQALVDIMTLQNELLARIQKLKGSVDDLSSTITSRKQEDTAMTEYMDQLQEENDLLRHNITVTMETRYASDNQNSEERSPGGAVYIRWGHKSCPNNATGIYKGMTAMSYWRNNYGGSNYQCVSLDPEWSRYAVGGVLQNRPTLFGTEFEEDEYFEGEGSVGSSPFDMSGSGLTTVDNHDVPCIACHVAGRGAVVMVPAQTTCPAGWVEEYVGYLMAEGHDQFRSSYICVDRKPEVQAASERNIPESTAYFVEVECGVLPCTAYPATRELTCVVCSK